MIGSAMRWTGLALLAGTVAPHQAFADAPPRATAAAAPCLPAGSGRALAAPPVAGTFGPFGPVTVATTRPTTSDRAAFDVRLRTGDGRCMILTGTQDPNELTLFQVTRVALVPLGRARATGLVVLYTEREIGPGKPTWRSALVYRAVRIPGGVRAQRQELDRAAGIADVQRQFARR